VIFAEALAFLKAGHAARHDGMDDGAYVFLAAGGRIVDGRSVREKTTASEDGPCVFLHGAPAEATVLPVLCEHRPGVKEIEVGVRLSARDLLRSDWYTRPL
jgi:hypothetical protein